MTVRRFVLLNLAFTGVNLSVALATASVLAYLYALLRGNLLPNGSTALDGPTGLWVWVNFAHYSLYFLAVGSVLGVAVGQVQFLAWSRQKDNQNPPPRWTQGQK